MMHSNPVARAIGLQKFNGVMRDWLILIHVLDDGDNCEDELVASARAMYIGLRSMELMGKRLDAASTNMRVALNAMEDCAKANFVWNKSYTKPINDGIVDLIEIYPQIPVRVLARAIEDSKKF